MSIAADHDEAAVNSALLRDSFGTGSGEFAAGLLEQVLQASRTGPTLKAKELNASLAFIRGISPRDETEALLAAQMVSIHNATMVAARRLQHTETITQQDSASNMLNKLARTFAMQLDTLKRYRSSGEQTIKVQHVTVNSGGQAIVGDVNQGGGSNEKQQQPHAPQAEGSCAAAGGTPLLGHVETQPFAMSGAGGEGMERLQVARRPRRRAKGAA